MEIMKEITLTEFVLGESKKLKLTTSAIHRRIKSGRYPEMRMRRINRRVILVTIK